MDNRVYLVAAAVGIPLLALLWNGRKNSHPPFPPGPKRDPIIGSARSFPRSRWPEAFDQWQTKYGDIIYANILGSHILIISSLDIARELMSNRGNIHSGRGPIPMVTKAMDWDWNIVMLNPGETHTETRRIFKQAVGQQEVAQYDELIQEGSIELVKALENVKGEPMDTLVSVVGSTVIKIAYGKSVHQEQGKELAEINQNITKLVTWTVTQLWMISFIPAVHYLPDWLPLSFKKVGARGKKWQNKLRKEPWALAVKHSEIDILEPSIASTYLESNEEQEDLGIVRDTLAMFYAGGVDNTAATLLVFIAALLQHPEVQDKIHAEMNRELGDQPPNFNDKARLPYLNAAWKEAMRLHPTTPLGVPHCAGEDDVYQGMYIPKGTTLMANVGFMARDPRIWEDPDVFKPERWLPEHNPDAASLPDVDDFLFGFGRRVCPGQFLAERISLEFAMSMLKAYTVAPLLGDTIPDEYLYNDSLLRFPQGVRCQFIPRTNA